MTDETKRHANQANDAAETEAVQMPEAGADAGAAEGVAETFADPNPAFPSRIRSSSPVRKRPISATAICGSPPKWTICAGAPNGT